MPGYNLQPVEDFARLQSLTCPCCDFLLKEAIQTEQGVRLCKSCFEQVQQYEDRTCPKTGLKIEPDEQYHPDVAVRKEVDKLVIKCALHEKGCTWTGSLKDHETNHKKSCAMTCQDCGETLPSETLDNHLQEWCPFRQISCLDCNEEMQRTQLEAHHQDHCPMRSVICPNCQTTMLHSEFEDHQLKHCPVQVCTVCDNKVYKDPSQSENVDNHLPNPTEVFEHFQMLGWKQQNTMNAVQRLEESQNTLRSDIQQGRVAIETANSQQIQRLQERIQKLERTEVKDVPPDITKIIKELTDKLDRHEKAIKSFPPEGGGGGGGYSSNQFSSLGSSERLMQLEKKVEEVERQTAMVKVSVSELELQLQASLASTYNGAFLWRIPDVKRRKRDAIESKITSIYSPPFYTGRNGYKMCIRAYLNGDGIGYSTHLSIFFVLMKGEYDPLLKWPFDYKVSLILVDQNHRRHIVQTFKPSPSSNSFKQPVQDMNVASGCPKFTELNVLDNEDYVKEDVMYIKCIVDTTRIFHP